LTCSLPAQAEKLDAAAQTKNAKVPAAKKSTTPQKRSAGKTGSGDAFVKSQQVAPAKAKRKQILDSDSDDDFEVRMNPAISELYK
jgi:hypothetical protein